MEGRPISVVRLHEERARTPATPFLSFRRRTRRRNLPLPGTSLPPRSQQRANGIPNLSRPAFTRDGRGHPPLHSCHSDAERGGGIYLSPELRCPRALNSARMEFPISVVRPSRGTSEDARHSILVIPKPNAAEESTSPRNSVALSRSQKRANGIPSSLPDATGSS